MSYVGNDWQAEAANDVKALAASKAYRDKVDLRVQVAGPKGGSFTSPGLQGAR
jgi:ribose transport system substrate-binding protein